MKRRGFLGAMLVALAPTASLTPALANGRSVAYDWALLQERVVNSPLDDPGYLYQALVRVNGNALACQVWCSHDPRQSVDMLNLIRRDAMEAARIHAELRAEGYYKENK